MTRETKRKISTFLRYFVLIAVGFVMVYPLIWMVGATFKTNNEIFSSVGFIPKNTDVSLTSRMIFSRWKRIQPMIAN